MANLIDEIFEAVAASQAEQEQRHRRRLELSGLSLDEFASRVITDGEIERELARLFPSESEGQLHGICPGARCQPQAHDILETPAIRTMLGLEIHRSEYRVTRQRGATPLKREAVERIRESLRLRIAAVRLSAIQQAVERGVPQVIVDSGRINVKLTFQVVLTEDADTPKLRDRQA